MLKMKTRYAKKNCWALRNEELKGWTNEEKNLKAILEKAYDWWNPYLRHTSKQFGNNSKQLKESGTMLGIDLWVRAHCKKTLLERIIRMRNDAPEWLQYSNEVTTLN